VRLAGAQSQAGGLLRAGLLVVLCLAAFLPGWWSIPPVDRDESRFAQASRQMVETGDLVDIRFQDEPRYKKPIGIYWLQAAVVSVLGADHQDRIWAYRIPSLVGAIAAVLLTGWLGAGLFGPTVGLLAAAMLAACCLLGVEARLAKTDAVLLAAIVAAQAALARLYLGPADAAGWPMAALFWSALGVAILIKGPVGPLVAAGTMLGLLALDRERAWLARLRWAWGPPLCLLIAGPWLIAIMLLSKGGFFTDGFAHDALAKLVAGQESHGAPPGSYLAAFWLTFWPWSLLAGLAVPWLWQRRHQPAIRFCLAWILPSWLFFELAASKLPHYVLPTYPAVALLTAAAALDGFGWRERDRRWWQFWPIAVLWAAVTLALAGAVALLPWLAERRLDPFAILAALAACTLCALMLHAIRRQAIRPALGAAAAAALILFGTAFGRVLPDLQAIWLAPRLQQAVALHRPCQDQPVAVAGYAEPSAVFLLGTATRLVRGAAAAAYLQEAPCRLVVVERREETAFQQALAAAGGQAITLAELAGYNFNGGDQLRLRLYVNQHW
jgi:4-amino-4-deoxy-L-arabinose transferase-like glycosyltransferase